MSSTTARPSHLRTTSSNSVKAEAKLNKKSPPEAAVHYTTFIRFPFPRNDFVDPPPVEWDAHKDRALWKIISRTSKTSDLDWEDLANHFGVEAGFMLQQAAWLYERHLQHVRAQMRKIQPPVAGSGSTGNVSSTGGYPMKRQGSGGSRAPSSLSVRARDSPLPKDCSGPSTPRIGAPPMSRTTSTNTVTQSRVMSSPRQYAAAKAGSRPISFAVSKRTDVAAGKLTAEDVNPLSPEAPSSPASSDSETTSSSSEGQEALPMRRSQLLKRPPRFGQKPKATLAKVVDDELSDDEDSALPFATRAQSSLDHSVKRVAQPRVTSTDNRTGSTAKGKSAAIVSPALATESSTSSASSTTPSKNDDRRPDLVSPHRRAELGRLNPRMKREGSEGAGTPSMGSSFSDLDGEFSKFIRDA